MAKGKHSTALFEVIQADKRFQKKTTRDGALRTPKWWFKSPGWRPSAGGGGNASPDTEPASPGNAAAGHAVDLWGPSTAYWVPVCIGVACAVVAAISTTFARPKTRFAHN